MRGRQRKPGVPSAKRQVNRLRNEMMGHKFTPAIDPPGFNERPWNDWTFSRTDSTAGQFQVDTLTVGDIITQIRGRCNINAVGPNSLDNYIQLRILRASVWCTVAETLLQPDLAVSFFELSGDNKVVRKQLRDLGTLNRPAKVGYQYPVTDSQDVLDNDNAANIVLQSTATSTGSVNTYRIKVLWRSGYQST
jgi:hypothetical protein